MEPTRTDIPNSSNILDLFFTNMPDLVNKQRIIPGISDHDIPILDIDTHVILNKKKAPRKVYIYSKGNMPNLINELSDYAHKFERKYDDPTHSDIDEMWLEFKKSVQKAIIDSNVPSKRVSGSSSSIYFNSTTSSSQYSNRLIQYRHNGKLITFLEKVNII